MSLAPPIWSQPTIAYHLCTQPTSLAHALRTAHCTGGEGGWGRERRCSQSIEVNSLYTSQSPPTTCRCFLTSDRTSHSHLSHHQADVLLLSDVCLCRLRLLSRAPVCCCCAQRAARSMHSIVCVCVCAPPAACAHFTFLRFGIFVVVVAAHTHTHPSSKSKYVPAFFFLHMQHVVRLGHC